MRARSSLLLVPVLALGLSGCGIVESFLGAEPERDPGTGEIVESSDASVMAIRVGDCVTSLDALSGMVDTVPTTPCADPHEAEVYASHVLAEGEFPGDDALQAEAEERCVADFGTFVGTPWEESVLDYTFLVPNQDGWDRLDDREILCIVVDVEAPVTGSLEGAAR